MKDSSKTIDNDVERFLNKKRNERIERLLGRCTNLTSAQMQEFDAYLLRLVRKGRMKRVK